jgi:hypothetical protein
MNPKHFHTPISTRLRCPVCHQPVYSRGGIHPQCAMRQSEPALVPAEVPIIADVPEEVIATVVAKVAPVKPRPVVPVLAPAPIAKLARVRR